MQVSILYRVMQSIFYGFFISFAGIWTLDAIGAGRVVLLWDMYDDI